ncbi:MAG: hypothetical protein HKN05_05965 [Rhizobiales bacterium]|nr:hypothetical protein [Hyphomicrobiales bacterium]
MNNSLVALLIFGAAQAHAGACGPDTADDITSFEQAKAAFLQADYETFFNTRGPYFPGADYDALFGQARVVFPNPFTGCKTVLQRREKPGFFQDLVFYFPAGSDAPLALLLIGAEVDGQVNLVEFSFNTNISNVLDDLK